MTALKGIIALDLDGTVTHHPKTLDKELAKYLSMLMKEGWLFIFITGRSFAFAFPVLSGFSERYYLACQNGTQLFEMPQKKTLIKHTIDASLLFSLETHFQKENLPLVIESGYGYGDETYYHPSDFATPELEKYLKMRISLSADKWVAVDSFQILPIKTFALAKFFAKKEEAHFIENEHLFCVITMRDPFRPGYFLTHINNAQATKGHILEEFCQKFPKVPTIVAGDDFNDYGMLLKGDVKIVMDHAPDALKNISDIIVPAERGLILGLKKAIAEKL